MSVKKSLHIFFIVVFFTLKLCATNPIAIMAPVTISTPGNYSLAVDITGQITIAADNVTLDLDGNMIQGEGGPAISMTGQAGITIKNGFIKGATNGVFLSTCSDVKIEQVTFSDNTLNGVSASTNIGLCITDCVFHNNTNGVSFSFFSRNCLVAHNKFYDQDVNHLEMSSSLYNVIKNNECSGAGSYGFFVVNSSNNVIEGNMVNQSENSGIRLNASFNNILRSNQSNNSVNEHGIFLTAASNNNLLDGNLANQNALDGINILNSQNNELCNNSCNQNQNGLVLDTASNNLVVKNSFLENIGVGTDGKGILLNNSATFNILDGNICNNNNTGGISILANSTDITIKNCIANNSPNSSSGIFVEGERTLITYCVCNLNGGNGIVCAASGGNVFVSYCSCESNDGDAIRVSAGTNNSVHYCKCEGNSGSGLNLSSAGASVCAGFNQFNANGLFGILTVGGSALDYYYNTTCGNSSASYSINGSSNGVVQIPGDACQASSNLKMTSSS
jgi:parallel beta-helix repeat protein